MKLSVLFFFLLSQGFIHSQITVYNKNPRICTDSLIYVSDSLHTEKLLFIFSSESTSLSDKEADSLIALIYSGTDLYCGLDNEPLQSECRQLMQKMFGTEIYSFDEQFHQLPAREMQAGNLSSKLQMDYEETPVYFPMDIRFQVEFWQDDQPLIISTTYGAGKIIFDGSYSRFYCDRWTSENRALFKEIINYFLRD